MRLSSCALLLLLASCPSYCFAWTEGEWLGVVEAAAGSAALRPILIPSSDICENCNGTGKLGDGTVSVECPVCDGTGKPVQSGKYGGEDKDCQSCQIPVRIDNNPTPPGMDAPDLKQDAKSSSGGTYNPRMFRRRR